MVEQIEGHKSAQGIALTRMARLEESLRAVRPPSTELAGTMPGQARSLIVETVKGGLIQPIAGTMPTTREETSMAAVMEALKRVRAAIGLLKMVQKQ